MLVASICLFSSRAVCTASITKNESALKSKRVRQARQKARPLEEKGVRILRENLSSFSEVDACLALGARLARVRQKVKRWKKYAVILEKDCQIFLKRSSLLSASRFGKDVRKDHLGKKTAHALST
ncbi:hypothetical protein DBT48_09015 [Aerococcus mictus]|nr:hypothetical protein HMPREF2680_00845 [Aerococcus mictus]PKY81364.1 hypothetical protein CYJ31_09640 [Aerococcus mictus]PMB92598.1 hypothetical protein CK795_09535 [Aerococcus mictus]RAV61336.1 hypothetical protein DBT35_09765 [Aerococcus mictus]RAV70406.1 hypothetical protein DBT47_08170 [Aerococcus mictus]